MGYLSLISSMLHLISLLLSEVYKQHNHPAIEFTDTDLFGYHRDFFATSYFGTTKHRQWTVTLTKVIPNEDVFIGGGRRHTISNFPIFFSRPTPISGREIHIA